MKSYLLLILGLVGVATIHFWKPEHSPGDKVFQSPPKDIRYYTLGYDQTMASLFWVRAVQDLFTCDQDRGEFTPRSSFAGGADPLDDVLSRELPPARCEKGWVYKMIDLVTDLDPTFRVAFEVGGTFLSVAVDDREGASLILKKGTKAFPEDWKILFASAYNELFEMRRPEQAAQLLHRAAQRGAPPWIYSLAAGLYSKLGQAHFAKSILESVVERKPKGPMADRINFRLEQINQLLEKEKNK